MFSDINTLPPIFRMLIYTIPFSYPMIAARSGFMDGHSIAYIGIIYITVFTIVILHIAAKTIYN